MRRMNVGLRTMRIVPQGSVVAVVLPPMTAVVVPLAVGPGWPRLQRARTLTLMEINLAAENTPKSSIGRPEGC